MPRQSVADNPSLMVWQAETLRMTAFPSLPTQITEPNWWTDLVGEPPETRLLRPREGEQREEGPFESGKLVLKIQPVRIDLLFIPAASQEPEVENIQTIGPFPDSLDIFSQLTLRWFKIETCPPVQRLAFGAILLQPVENQQTGYQHISTYLPSVKLDPEGSSDFSYQINRPRNSSSGVTNLRINRLSKWSVSVQKRAQFSLGPALAGYLLGPEHFACRLELDVNTAPDFQGELPQEQLPRIFQELVDLGKEIATRGDIP